MRFHTYLAELDSKEHLYVNAHINNISFPTSLENLEFFIFEHGRYNVEDILYETTTNWTVPRSAKIGDVVFFFHAKTAISRITALITQVKALPDNTKYNKSLFLKWLEHARSLYKTFGGKIFAIARVTGSPEYWGDKDSDFSYHWNSRVYADISDICVLDTPIDISEFNSFIRISRQSAITPLPRNEFNQLRSIVTKRNRHLPYYFAKCEIGNFNLSKINIDNFLTVTQEYRRRFLLEIDFRSYYVDYLLRALTKRKFWRECICYRSGKPHYFVDNVFFYNGTYYLLEVKLNIKTEKNLRGQLKQYIYSDYITLNKEGTKQISDFERDFMYVLDTEALYLYDTCSDSLTTLVSLDNVQSIEDLIHHMPREQENSMQNMAFLRNKMAGADV